MDVKGRPYKESEYLIDKILFLTTRIRDISSNEETTQDELESAVEQLENIVRWMEGDDTMSSQQRFTADIVSYITSGGKLGR